MSYTVKRGEQEFGPYTLAELQQYVQIGNIVAGDLTRSEGADQWVPVSSVLGDIPVASLLQIAPESLVPTVALPLNIPWPVMLLSYAFLLDRLPLPTALMAAFGIANFFISILVLIWMFILANWARKLNGKNTALVLAAMYLTGVFTGAFAFGIGVAAHLPALTGIGGLILFAGVVCLIACNFAVRAAMEYYYNSVEDIALALSGVMTFFFGMIYFQFHINRIARWKQTGTLD